MPAIDACLVFSIDDQFPPNKQCPALFLRLWKFVHLNLIVTLIGTVPAIESTLCVCVCVRLQSMMVDASVRNEPDWMVHLFSFVEPSRGALQRQ